jgi:hypothetical protein
MQLPRITLALALSSSLPALAEDLTIVSKVTRDANPPATATSYIASDHVRMSQGDDREFMLDFASGNMTILDGKKKEYSVITPKDIEAMKARMQEQMKKAEPQMQKMQEQMQKMPPEMRAKMEKMMGGMAASVSVQKGPGTRTIAGYPCQEWTISMGGMSTTKQCNTTALPFPVQAWDRYKDFADSMKSMFGSMGPMAKGFADMQEKFREMKGIALATQTTTSVLGKTSVTSSEVTEIKKGAIPASAWQIPAGYKKVESPMTKGLPAK